MIYNHWIVKKSVTNLCAMFSPHLRALSPSYYKNSKKKSSCVQNGQTACAIADRLGYISAVEALRPVTENTLSQAVGDTGKSFIFVSHCLA